jgi:hypothetical protein
MTEPDISGVRCAFGEKMTHVDAVPLFGTRSMHGAMSPAGQPRYREWRITVWPLIGHFFKPAVFDDPGPLGDFFLHPLKRRFGCRS